MSELIAEIKNIITQELKLTNELDQLTPDTPLFNNPYITLDSIDGLGIIVILQKKYGIRIKDLSQGKKILHSLNTIAEFVKANRQ